MENWTEHFIMDLADILNHKRIPLSSGERAKRQGKYPYYGASGIIDHVDGYIFEGEHVLISEDGENLKSRKTPIAFLADGKFWVNNHAHIVKGKSKYLNKLIVYYLESTDLHPFLTGAVQPKLNKENLVAIPFFLPENEDEQKAITNVLSSLDDKIDLLHKQNQKLEELAGILFRQWFIAEVDEDIELSDFMEINPREKLSKGAIAPYLEMKNVQSDSSYPSDWYEREFSSGTKFRNGDTLLARITPCLENGKSAYVQFLESNEQVGWGSTEFLVFRTKPGFHPFCSYLLAKNEDFKAFAVSNMTGSSGRQRVQTESLFSFSIGRPTDSKLSELNEIFESTALKINANAKQIQKLEKLRNTLLPKLMNGEVRVKI